MNKEFLARFKFNSICQKCGKGYVRDWRDGDHDYCSECTVKVQKEAKRHKDIPLEGW